MMIIWLDNILQGAIEGNIQTLQQENNDMKKILNESSNAGAINADTIDAQVFPSNPLSEKLIKYHCKTACIEDAMGVIKKAFQTDKIDLKEYLGHIR